ncbi:MAG: isoprenylcysteine carboxylmethyltransferase family protein [Chloroflexi bacterium]|nr:isoprenylcysteine carboxylmethyltransferase family protein [Chloroflexota bacterium]
MELKGIEQLRARAPDLNTTGGVIRMVLYGLTWIILFTLYFIFTDRIPTWSIDSQIVVITLGYVWLSLFFSRKNAYKQKYGELAYHNACAHFAIPGLMVVFSAAAHTAYTNGPSIPSGWWTDIFIPLGWLMILIGAGLAIRGVLAFGVDNVAMLYVYFPEDGRIVDSNIYSVLRHPVYAGALRVVIGLGLLNGNANALAFVILLPLMVFGWLRFVEEKELIERFGQSYLDYRARVPAFWPRLPDLPAFFRFLFTGK